MNNMDVHLEIDYDTCPLCINHIEINNNKILGCSHNYCSSCINEWLETHCSCPLCNYNINGQIELFIDEYINKSNDIHIEEIDDYPIDTSFNYNNIDYNLPKKLLVFSHTYNIMRIMSGMSGLTYSK